MTRTTHPTRQSELSAAGIQRRADILDLAQAAAGQRRRRQTRQAATTIALIVAIAAVAVWQFAPEKDVPIARQSQPTPAPTGPLKTDVEPVPENPRRPLVTLITPTAQTPHVTCFDSTTEPVHVRSLTDEELLQTLASYGLDAGLMYRGDQTVLLPRGWTPIEPSPTR